MKPRNIAFSAAVLALAACESAKTDPVAPSDITPEPFVAPPIDGFAFPVNETTISSWTTDLDGSGADSIALHAWGLWAGLTALTDQTWNGQALRTFETWDTPTALTCIPQTGPDGCPKTPRPLRSPNQLKDKPTSLAVTVGYDPTLAAYVLENSIIDKKKLNSLQGAGAEIGRLTLPATSIATKPTYMVLSRAQGQYALMKTWDGPPATPQAWGPDKWPTCVWVDLDDATASYGPFEPARDTGDLKVCSGNKPLSPENVVPLGAFIHFKLDAEEADLARGAGVEQASEGDSAVLIGMHVTSRESDEQITRWTWQTFWWSTNVNDGVAPSTAAMVSQRPGDGLKARNAQAANYAGCSAYQMLYPDQPKTGGDPAGGAPVFCYNPHLEAPFDASSDLPLTSNTAGWTYNGKTYAPKYGVETNCMSCHLNAAWSDGSAFAQGGLKNPLPNCEQKANGLGCYDATVYIDMNAPYFKGAVTTDALWSIPDSVP